MIIAITGGTGFIGAQLVRAHLARGDRVRVLTRRPVPGLPAGVEAIRGDLADAAALAALAEGADVLYHCAAELRDAARMQAVNVEGTARLVGAAAGKVGRWVQLSSIGVYGRRREGEVTEDTPLAPAGPYETSKAESDRIVQMAAAEGAFPAVLLRPAIVFGPGMPSRFMGQWIALIERGLFFHVGAPGAWLPLTPAADVVAALLLCATCPEAVGRTYNLSGGCTVETFVQVVAHELGRSPPRLRVPELPLRMLALALGWLPGFPLTAPRLDALTSRVRYPAERIRCELGFTPAVGIEEALAEMVAAWKARP